MPSNILLKVIPLLIIISAIGLVDSYAQQKPDPFSRYRDFVKKPLSIEPKDLKHYAREEQLIREKLALDLSTRERSILAGIHWLLTFMDKDDNFDSVFPDFMLLMNTLTHSEDRVHQREIATSVVKQSLMRAEKKLSYMFEKSEPSRWGFISLLHILTNYPELEKSYHQFYRDNFAPIDPSLEKKLEKDFDIAIQAANYKRIFDILVESSFLHYYLLKEKNPDISLPTNKYQHYLREFEKFSYIDDHPIGPQFRNLGYLVTHVVLILTNYGEFPIEKNVVAQKAEAYIASSFDKARTQLGDFDLLAEYVQCLKIFNPGKNSRQLSELENFILELQRPNGSWGSEHDFKEGPYTSIHPSGAALMALNQSNFPRPK